ncbi:hypothetical protein A3A95_00770 [Candidatus Nomurabacteria bacterium RIFCSPLOWO2_01_FULL_39_18]|uniref:Uncharacterized protein n=1 Tax=Candidatus Nomurabacteria bacterium RIFCSPHIGHO2_01_FULL_40_24b TaxID=1801739 RepID=A0A1F6V714_9BACT|nr:MAG: hypothetical protein A2647_02570 [Candidatus Nomurabacteria bacterium RIFCSPHIGHO2_01_FULL_40_24b]OGI89844.1 MAG: hypothetical protein A3A95_00770 [Candidatus Nomurabacteria bacterium RIFCSPLOWO2_01_FULL_39_18]
MRRIIHHLRRQPEETKRHILHIVTIVFGIILFSLWVYSLGVNFSEMTAEVKENDELNPLSVLKGNIIDGYQSINDPDLMLPE